MEIRKKKRILVNQPYFDFCAAFPIRFKPLAAPKKKFQNRNFLPTALKKEKKLLPFTKEKRHFRIKGPGIDCGTNIDPKNRLPSEGFHHKTKVIFTPNENNFQFLSNSRQTFLSRRTQNYQGLCINKSGKSCKSLSTVNFEHIRPEKYFAEDAEVDSFTDSDDSTVEDYCYISNSEGFLQSMAPNNTEKTRLSVRSEERKTTGMNPHRAKNSITSVSDSDHSVSYKSPNGTESACSYESDAASRTDDTFTVPRQSWSQNRKKVLVPIQGKQNYCSIKSGELETKNKLHELQQNTALKTFRNLMPPSVRGELKR